MSVGVATFDDGPPPADEMLVAADGLLYEAERSGRDATCHARAGGADGRRSS